MNAIHSVYYWHFTSVVLRKMPGASQSFVRNKRTLSMNAAEVLLWVPKCFFFLKKLPISQARPTQIRTMMNTSFSVATPTGSQPFVARRRLIFDCLAAALPWPAPSWPSLMWGQTAESRTPEREPLGGLALSGHSRPTLICTWGRLASGRGVCRWGTDWVGGGTLDMGQMDRGSAEGIVIDELWSSRG